MQAVNLAPFGMNLQPWYFEKNIANVLVYEQILKPHMSFLYKKTAIDIGIAICHYAVVEIDK